MDRITRKELKSDKFVQEVGRTVNFLETHRKNATLIGGIVLAAIVLGAGVFYWMRYQHGVRQTALTAAFEIFSARIGPAAPIEGDVAFPDTIQRKAAAKKAFADIAAKHSGSDEGDIAVYMLATIAMEDGSTSEAEKLFKQVADSGSKEYAALSKLALSSIYMATNKAADAEKLLRELVAEPTGLVSKDQATLNLVRVIMKSKPDEAKKLLEPLRDSTGAASRAAVGLLAEMSTKQ